MIRLLASVFLLLALGAGAAFAQDDCTDESDCDSASAEQAWAADSEEAGDSAASDEPLEDDAAQAMEPEDAEPADEDAAEPALEEQPADDAAGEADANPDPAESADEALEGDADAVEPDGDEADAAGENDIGASDEAGADEQDDPVPAPEAPPAPQPASPPAPATPAAPPAPATTPPASSSRIGLVDVERVLTESSAGRALRQQLEVFHEQVKTESEAKRVVIVQLRSRLDQGAGSLSQTESAALRTQIEAEETNLRRWGEDKQREFQKLQEAGLLSLERQLMPVIEQVRVERGFDMIVRKNDSGVLSSGGHVDVTQQVLERLR